MPGKYPTNPILIKELLALRADLNATNGELAQQLGIPNVTLTFLSKYLNDNLDRVVEGFEALAFDVIKSIRQRIAFGTEIFEHSVTRRMANTFNLIRKTGDIALITSPAGNGKTCGRNLYQIANPSTVVINLNATTRHASKVEGALFSQVEHRDWKGQCSRFDYLVKRFKGSSRLLIVDNAQRLDSSGRQFLFDFHDEADCPIGMIGNPETLDRIRTNDQQYSRIGIYANYELRDDELPACSQRVAHQYSNAATAEAIADLVAYIAAREGRLRAVRKTVVLAQELRNVSAELRDNPRKAIRAAHSRLVRDYMLPGD